MSKIQTKSFLKWAGGKTQLLETISSKISYKYKSEDKFIYIEPFVGSRAVLFWISNNYPNLKKAIINDINFDLINSYKTIKTNVSDLILILKKWQSEYHSFLDNQEAKKKYYYAKRDLFNKRNNNPIIQTALFIYSKRGQLNELLITNTHT